MQILFPAPVPHGFAAVCDALRAASRRMPSPARCTRMQSRAYVGRISAGDRIPHVSDVRVSALSGGAPYSWPQRHATCPSRWDHRAARRVPRHGSCGAVAFAVAVAFGATALRPQGCDSSLSQPQQRAGGGRRCRGVGGARQRSGGERSDSGPRRKRARMRASVSRRTASIHYDGAEPRRVTLGEPREAWARRDAKVWARPTARTARMEAACGVLRTTHDAGEVRGHQSSSANP